MWQDEIVEEIHRIRVRAASPSGEEYAKSFNYDLDAIFTDLQNKQAQSGREVVSLSPKHSLIKRWSRPTTSDLTENGSD